MLCARSRPPVDKAEETVGIANPRHCEGVPHGCARAQRVRVNEPAPSFLFASKKEVQGRVDRRPHEVRVGVEVGRGVEERAGRPPLGSAMPFVMDQWIQPAGTHVGVSGQVPIGVEQQLASQPGDCGEGCRAASPPAPSDPAGDARRPYGTLRAGRQHRDHAAQRS
jgi:hypothetical protein